MFIRLFVLSFSITFNKVEYYLLKVSKITDILSFLPGLLNPFLYTVEMASNWKFLLMQSQRVKHWL